MFDVIIIGAGPAGLGAAVYSQKLKLKTLVVAKSLENLAPDAGDSGFFSFLKLKEKFLELCSSKVSGLEFRLKEEIVHVDKNVVSFSVESKSGQTFYSKSLILAYGQGLEFGLENLTDKTAAGKIKVDNNQQTNISGLLAAGLVAVGEGKDVFTCAAEGARSIIYAGNFIGEKK